ncbi:MAG: sialidase family protein [Odoribacter sp.]
MNTKILILLPLLYLLAIGCYEEEHLSFPGPYEIEGLVGVDTLPNPFGRAHRAGYWLIKDGAVDDEQVAFRGYTDFVPTVESSLSSWYREGGALNCRPHYNPSAMSNAAHFNGDNLSYQSNDLYSRGFLEAGKGKRWYVYAKMSMDYAYNNQRFDYNCYVGSKGWGNRAVFFSNHNDVNYPCCTWFFADQSTQGILKSAYHNGPDYWMPGATFEIECVCVDGVLRIGFNNTWMFTYNTPDAASFPFMFRPWRNGVHVYDLYIEGDYQPAKDMVAYRGEEGYTTIQRPALTRKDGEVFLFAEARKYNVSLTTDVMAKRSNATDIILKHSVNNGESWDALKVVVGGEAVNMSPCVVTDKTGKIHLFYTVSPQGQPLGKANEIYHRTSSDGVSWSEAVRINAGVLAETYTVETLNGHGCCMENGRLVVPLKYSLGRNGMIAMLVSDDGSDWKLGETIEGERNQSCDVAEQDGKLMCVLAQTTGGNKRMTIFSEDGGFHWGNLVELEVNTGQGGNQLDGATIWSGNGTLVHFTPTGQVKGATFSPSVVSASLGEDIKSQKIMYIKNSPNFSMGMTVSVSTDKGKQWSNPQNVFTRQTFKDYVYRVGYMDAIALDGNTVLCVYEGGMEVPYEGLRSYKQNIK